MITFEQYGPVALMLEDGKAISVATFADGVWTTDYQRQENETRSNKRNAHWAHSLERLAFEMRVRPDGEWIGRDTVRVPDFVTRYRYQPG